METPNTPAGRLTDRIMIAIAPFIVPGGYNRAWSKVLAIAEHELGTVPAVDPPPAERCKKMVRGTMYRCRRAEAHEGPCGLQP